MLRNKIRSNSSLKEKKDVIVKQMFLPITKTTKRDKKISSINNPLKHSWQNKTF